MSELTSPRYYWLLLILTALVVFPQIDITVSMWFFSDGHFFLRKNKICEWIRIITPLLIFGIALLLLLSNIVSVIITWNPFRLNFLKVRTLCYLLSSLVLGPGLLVNSLLKEHWGRARPTTTTIFGGSKDFAPALMISDQCTGNCSFVSGHVALAFWAVSFVSLSPPLWRRFLMIITVLYGCLVGFVRIAQGSHFLSDVVFAAVLVICVNHWLRRLFTLP